MSGPPPEPTDRELVARFQQGDRDAFGTIFEREWPAVHRILAATVRERAEVEDLTQEVFVRAFTGLTRYVDTGRPLAAYLSEIARNLLRDRWRRKQTRPAEVSELPELPSERPSPDTVVEAGEQRMHLAAALAQLPEQYQRVLRMRILEGRSSAEVAEAFSLNTNALRQLQFRALRALRAVVEAGDSDETGGGRE